MQNYNISVVRIAGGDRNLVLFTSAEHNVLKGINFWPGSGENDILKHYLEPDKPLSEWVLKRLRLANEEWAEYSIICPDYEEIISNIDTAISGYIQHRHTPQLVTLPKAQSEQIIDALFLLQRHYRECNLSEYDAITLRALMHYPVTIAVTREEQENFCKNHGIDFPEYN